MSTVRDSWSSAWQLVCIIKQPCIHAQNQCTPCKEAGLQCYRNSQPCTYYNTYNNKKLTQQSTRVCSYFMSCGSGHTLGSDGGLMLEICFISSLSKQLVCFLVCIIIFAQSGLAVTITCDLLFDFGEDKECCQNNDSRQRPTMSNYVQHATMIYVPRLFPCLLLGN